MKPEAWPVSCSLLPPATFFPSQQNPTAAPSTEKHPPGQRLRVGPLPPVTLKLKRPATCLAPVTGSAETHRVGGASS